jgi:uncharacterized protein (DUF1697 family)
MPQWVALLRGINLGPRNKVPMAELTALCGELGLRDVRTYIASGNLLCSSSHRSAASLRSVLERGLRHRFGFDVPVMVRTPGQLRDVVAGLPFTSTEQVHVSFLSAPLGAELVAELQQGLVNDAELVCVGSHAYLRTPGGLGQPFLRSGPARRFGAEGTVRTWRTVTTLVDLCGGPAGRAAGAATP